MIARPSVLALAVLLLPVSAVHAQDAYRYGYIRTVSGEHWHWEYVPDEAATMAAAGKFKRAGVSP